MNAQKGKNVNDSLRVISFKIAEDWSAFDFEVAFNAIHTLYNTELLRSGNFLETYAIVPFTNLQRDSVIMWLATLNFPKDRIALFDRQEIYKLNNFFDKKFLEINYFIPSIKKITYASPGQIDFLGIGSIINGLFDILKYYFPNKRDSLINELNKTLNLDKRIDLLNKEIDFLEKLGIPRHTVKAIIENESEALDVLDEIIKNNYLLDVETKSNEKE